MAYFSKEQKKEMAPKIKAVLKKYNMKGSLSICNYSTVVLTLKSGAIDFGDASTINVYWVNDHFDGVAKEFLNEILDILNEGNFDKSDLMSDYCHVGWYVNIRLGGKAPYMCTA